MNGTELKELRHSSSENFVISSSYFEMGKRIGKGQFGEVYEAYCKKDGSKVAIKKVKMNEMTDVETRLDCLKEMNILQQLSHPNIITYLASFIEYNVLHIVLELANLGDLGKMIQYFRKQRRLISEKSIWNCFVQVASALQYMHMKRIMHRDIKPANIFLNCHGIIKLGDLGLGRLFSNKTAAAYSLVGTPYYMSPERLNECGYNFKSDIWSAGCLLYELAALHGPFYGDKMNLHTLCKKIEACDYPPLPSDLYSQKLRDLIASCLRTDPESRPDISYIHEYSKAMNECTFKS